MAVAKKKRAKAVRGTKKAARTAKNRIAGVNGAGDLTTSRRRKTGYGDAEDNSPRQKPERVTITAPDMQLVAFKIRGDAPLVINAFGPKARQQMRDIMAEGDQPKKTKKKRPPKDFKAEFIDAQHISDKNWLGISAAGFRNAAIRACSLCGFKMTVGKMSLFIIADGFDKHDGTPLVKITKGKPKKVEHCVRLPNGAPDIRSRPMWDPGWEAVVLVRYDADQFGVDDVSNLMARIGWQVGVGEGRAFSKNSAGMGWGSFEIVGAEQLGAAKPRKIRKG